MSKLYMPQRDQLRRGILKIGPLISIIAATTPVAIWPLSLGRKAKLVKIHVFNNTGGTILLEIGTGVGGAFARSLPRFAVFAGTDRVISEDELVAVQFAANITAQANGGAAAPNDIQIRAEVIEYRGVRG